jgi:hypothetical protein
MSGNVRSGKEHLKDGKQSWQIWPLSKSLTKGGGPKSSSAIHGPLGPIFYPTDNAKTIAYCLANQSTAHDLCNCDYRRHVGAQAEALEDMPVKFRPCDVSKETQSLKLRKVCDFDGILNERLRHLPRRPLVYFIHIFIQSLPSSWTLPDTVEEGKNHNSAETRQKKFLKTYLRSASCPLRANYLRSSF